MEKRHEIADSLKDFGRNLRKVRMAKKLTLEIVAERADLNIRTLQRFEAGTSNACPTTFCEMSPVEAMMQVLAVFCLLLGTKDRPILAFQSSPDGRSVP